MQAFGSVPGEGSTLQLGTGSESHQEHSMGNDHPVKEILSDAEETTRAAPLGLAFGSALALGGLGALAFGVYALVRGGRDQSGGGLGGFSERDIHAIAGLRMVAGGAVSLVFGALLLWSYFSG